MQKDFANSDLEYEDYSEEDTPPTNNYTLNFKNIFSIESLRSRFSRFFSVCGNLAWIITTSVILVGLPLLFAYDREKAVEAYAAEQERFNTDPNEEKKNK